jgi:hypothetical protein
MADIFVSYTSSDRDWAFWIGQELQRLGHVPRLQDWEVSGGGNVAEWTNERFGDADYILCVISEASLKDAYSGSEHHVAQLADMSKRPNFTLPVFIEACETPILFAPLKRCDLHGLKEDEARARLAAFIKPAERLSGPVAFPGTKKVGNSDGDAASHALAAFPERVRAVSNIPIAVPLNFLGRDKELAAIDAALKRNKDHVAITVLHGMRGAGKTILTAAYAEKHANNYRATWWIRAETKSTMRADLVGLGVRLGWVAADDREEPALAAVLERLRD